MKLIDKKYYPLIGAFLLYIIIFISLQFFQFDLRFDETHYHDTSTFLTNETNINKLKDYNELSTPLPFIVFGIAEKITNIDYVEARLINFIISLIIIGLILIYRTENKKISILSSIGLLLFPYFLFTSTHIYTDIIASFFVLLGFIFYEDKKNILSTVSFILAIASRQYMVAFPVTILIYELIKTKKISKNIIYPLISSSSIFFWYLFFGGFGPKTTILNHQIITEKIFSVVVHNSLYFLSCVGLYFVVFEIILFRKNLKVFFQDRNNIYIALIMLILFIIWPPLGNINNPIISMGLLDSSLRIILPTFLRIATMYILATLTIIRFSKERLALVLLLTNALLMMKAQIGWDKYILPLLVILWFLKSKGKL